MSRNRPTRNQQVRLTGVVEGIRHGDGNGQSGDLGVSDVASIEKGQEVGDSKRGQDPDLGGIKERNVKSDMKRKVEVQAGPVLTSIFQRTLLHSLLPLNR